MITPLARTPGRTRRDVPAATAAPPAGITGSQTHKLYDDARMMFGQTYPIGTTVRLEADSADTALPYTIDVADFYNVPAAATQPANSISVVSEGADPTGAADSTTAFRNAISAWPGTRRGRAA